MKFRRFFRPIPVATAVTVLTIGMLAIPATAPAQQLGANSQSLGVNYAAFHLYVQLGRFPRSTRAGWRPSAVTPRHPRAPT